MATLVDVETFSPNLEATIFQKTPLTDQKPVKTRLARRINYVKEAKYLSADSATTRSSQILLFEEPGTTTTIGTDEKTTHLSQIDIVNAVDVLSAHKSFDLQLDKLGPYRVDYSRNGRHLSLLGTGGGHLAAFDWQSKQLIFEAGLMEACRDVAWLHDDYLAVAQNRWLYIYDKQGIEVHCIKGNDRPERLEFLPYHFLLASGNAVGYLSWLDVSIGKHVAGFQTHTGRINVMTQNASSGVIHVGQRNGVVSLWSPNVKQPLAQLLTHRTSLRSMAIDNTGNYMATSGSDRQLRIWDLRAGRKFGDALRTVTLPAGAASLTISQRGCLAAAYNDTVLAFDNIFSNGSDRQATPFLKHRVPNGKVVDVAFCPFEDIAAIGFSTGIASILVPGSGEPNFDALESNPYQSRSQRREAQVRRLLDKVQPEMIGLDATRVLQVHRPSVIADLDAKRQLTAGSTSKISVDVRNKVRGLSREKRKNLLKGKELAKRKQQYIEVKDNGLKNRKWKRSSDETAGKSAPLDSVLGRFRKGHEAGQSLLSASNCFSKVKMNFCYYAG